MFLHDPETNKCTWIMEIVIYFLKENKHHMKCLYACTQAHVRYMCACMFVRDTDRRSCRVQNTEQRGQYEYERGTGMFILLCRAQKERMCNHTHTHPGDIFTQVSMEQYQPGCTNPIHQLLKPKTPEDYRMRYSMCECVFVFVCVYYREQVKDKGGCVRWKIQV